MVARPGPLAFHDVFAGPRTDIEILLGPRAVHVVSPGRNGWLLALDSLWLCELLLDVVLELESLLEPDETLVELLLLDALLLLALDTELSLESELWLVELLPELWLESELLLELRLLTEL